MLQCMQAGGVGSGANWVREAARPRGETTIVQIFAHTDTSIAHASVVLRILGEQMVTAMQCVRVGGAGSGVSWVHSGGSGTR